MAFSNTIDTIDTFRVELERSSGMTEIAVRIARMLDRDVEFVYDRFEELRLLLERWGWDVVERGDLSEWDEGRRTDPVMGLVRIRGNRDSSMPGFSFTLKEWWGWPPLDGPEERQGCVLAGYHYTAVSSVMVRHCYDPARHPEMPFHIHHGNDDPRLCDPITAEDALQVFEQRIAEELIASEGITVTAAIDDDDVDAVFGEEDAA